MSTSIHVRAWWRGAVSPPAAWGRLVGVLRDVGGGEPRGVTVKDARYRTLSRGDTLPDPLPAAVVASAHTSLPAWRFEPAGTGSRAVAGSVVATVSTWDAAWLAAAGLDRRVEGDLRVVLDPVGPFCALLGSGPEVDALNARVEENVERALDLVKALASTEGLEEVSVTTDAGEPIPVNQHLAWFADEGVVVRRAAWLLELARTGVPAYRLPPLASAEAAASAVILHGWRAPEDRARLAGALADPALRVPAPDDVHRLLQSGRFDWLEDPGLLLLDYPHAFNAFLDRFWLGVLTPGA